MEKIIEFIRKKDFKFIEELGQGACGKTVILYDDIIDQYFVCKKYLPINEDNKIVLYDKFIQEIKLLHLVYHPNIVRVFNYFLYPEHITGYIMMEYVNGYDIESYIERNPEKINEIFTQTINGFKHLEKNNILHRDIRPYNIMVDADGIVKIIDFGFGKQVFYEPDYNNSISLNWWCELPDEFNDKKYDFCTEVYFIGKLFEKIITEKDLNHFMYDKLLSLMCKKDPQQRIESFFNVNKNILTDKFSGIYFEGDQINRYRAFANCLYEIASKIESGTKYFDDIEKIKNKLEDLYRSTMLEEYIPDNSKLLGCFINGNYRYYPKTKVEVAMVKDFIGLLNLCSREKKNIILANLHSKIDSIDRYEKYIEDDDIPF